ncbi:MAG: hypothetical protein IIW10_01285 [Spirochaetaceae bacterium]|nr:hypothetical protein [Spirochaetaceae bacterium]
MKVFFAILIFILSLPVFPVEEKKISVTRVVYEIQGRTKEFFLKNILSVDETRKFSVEDLDLYLQELRQKLEETRIYSEIDLTAQVQDNEAQITVAVKEGGNTFVFPGPKYSSASGLSIKVIFRENNLFGTMNSLSADVAYLYDTQRGKHGFGPEFYMPFLLPLENWDLNFNLGFAGEIFDSQDCNFDFSAEISAFRRFENCKPGFGFVQGVVKNPDYRDWGNENYLLEKAFLTIQLQPWKLPDLTPVNWAFSAETETFISLGDCGLPKAVSHEGLREFFSPKIAFVHDFSMGNVRRKEKLREGFSLNIYQEFSYNFHPSLGEAASLQRFDLYTDVVAAGFFDFGWGGLALRGRFFGHTADGLFVRPGNQIRGIYDYRQGRGKASLECSQFLVFNVDFPIRLFRTDFYRWTDKKFFHSLDFELQLSPFVDFAFANGKNIRWNEGIFSLGGEILFYPIKWKFVQLRASFAANMGHFIPHLRDLPHNASVYEIYFGTELHF